MLTGCGMTLGEFLRERLEKHGYLEDGGRQRFIAILGDKYGVQVSEQSLSQWLNDRRRPQLGKLIGILDLLDVHGENRDLCFRLRAQPIGQGAASETESSPEQPSHSNAIG